MIISDARIHQLAFIQEWQNTTFAFFCFVTASWQKKERKKMKNRSKNKQKDLELASSKRAAFYNK